MSKILKNVFSNWAGLVFSVLIAFVVSPIIVNTLGKEMYGVWTLIVSITGYFTVLDFGVNTALVRYVSSAVANRDFSSARAVYSTSTVIFASVALAIFLFSLVFGVFLPDIFSIHTVTRAYLYAVFVISAVDLATGLLFSVCQGSLVALQEFRFINGTSICVNVTRSILLILGLHHGAGLLTLAILQLCASLARAACQYALLRRNYGYIRFDRHAVDRGTIRKIYNYSIPSFVIAIALKLLFYTDSVVIGSMLGVAEVAFYAIPATLLDYLEKFVWAIIAVLIPVISTNHARGEGMGNQRLYILGTRYSLLVSMPIVISLYFYGADFIRLWMGPEFGHRCLWVLRFLLIGFGFSFSQLIAHGILKGISKHKVLAIILAVEALANLGLSLLLSQPYGIEGVAIGTMAPLLAASAAIIAYSCRILGVPVLHYLTRGYAGAVLGSGAALLFIHFNPYQALDFLSLAVNCAGVASAYLAVALPVSLEHEHRTLLCQRLRRSTLANRGVT